MILVRTPKPQTTESLLGYVLRVSEANGYDTPWTMLSYAGFVQGGTRTAGFDVKKLVKILGHKDSELEGIAYCTKSENGSRKFKILSHELGSLVTDGQLRLYTPTLCPRCVQEKGYIDAFWNLAFAVACPCHACRPLDSCPACGKELQWFRPGLLTCKCGADLKDALLEPVNHRVTEVMAILFAKLHNGSVLDLPNTSGFPLHALETLSMRALLGIISGLGKFDLLSKGNPNHRERRLIVESAATVLSDWPNGYHNFLYRLGTFLSVAAGPSIGLRKQYERFYVAMFKAKSYAPEAMFLRDEFIKYGLTTWGEAIVDKKLLRSGDHHYRGRFRSSSTVARDAGIRQITLKRWAEKGLIPQREVRIGSQVRYILDADAIAITKQTPGRVMKTREAAARLGIPVSVLSLLRKSDHFEVGHMPKHKRGYHELDLDNFEQSVLDHSAFIDKTVLDNEPVISLEDVLMDLQFWSKTGKAEFVTAYLDGVIHSVGRIGNSLKDIQFRKIDVETYAKSARMVASAGTLSQQEVACFIGCNEKTIPDLIDNEYLACHRGPERMRVERQSFQKFSANYVALAKVAKQLNTTVTRLVRLCAKACVNTLSAPKKSGKFLPFISRQDYETLLQVEQQNPSLKKRQEMSRQNHISIPAKLELYFDSLLKNGALLPRCGRKVNKLQIAQACGINRDVFYDIPEVASMLKAFDEKERLIYNIKKRDDAGDLRIYLQNIKLNGDMLPRKTDGTPNIYSIAKACDINRNAFYNTDSGLASILDAYEAEKRLCSATGY